MTLDASKPVSAFLATQSFVAVQSSNLVSRFSEVVSERAAQRGTMSMFARRERQRRQARDAGATDLASLIGLESVDLDEGGFGAEETIEIGLTDETYRAYAQGLGRLSPEQKAQGLLSLLKSMPDLSESPRREVHGFASGAARAHRAGLPELPSHLRARVVVRLVDSLYLLPTPLQLLSWHVALQDAGGLLEADRMDVQDVLLAFLETHEALFRSPDALRRRIRRLSDGDGGRDRDDTGDDQNDNQGDPDADRAPVAARPRSNRAFTRLALRSLGGLG